MKGGTLRFPVVPHKDRAFSHHFDVDTFPSDFVLYSVLGPFMSADEKLGPSVEVVYLFEIKVVKFTHVIFQVQDDCSYPLGLNDPHNSIYFCILLFS